MPFSLHEGQMRASHRLRYEGADSSFGSGEGVAGAVEGLVIGVVLRAKVAKGFFAAPAVDGDIAAGDVGVFEQLGAQVIGRTREEACPGTVEAAPF